MRAASSDLCVQYRATNSFNAVTSESIKVKAGGTATQSATTCEGAPGEDRTRSVGRDLRLCPR